MTFSQLGGTGLGQDPDAQGRGCSLNPLTVNKDKCVDWCKDKSGFYNIWHDLGDAACTDPMPWYQCSTKKGVEGTAHIYPVVNGCREPEYYSTKTTTAAPAPQTNCPASGGVTAYSCPDYSYCEPWQEGGAEGGQCCVQKRYRINDKTWWRGQVCMNLGKCTWNPDARIPCDGIYNFYR
jgi:hypothetical protein